MNNSPSAARRILHVAASSRPGSKSRETADMLLAACRQGPAPAAVDELDLWAIDLPDMRDEVINAKYAVLARTPHEERQAQAWARVRAQIERFLAYDGYVFSVPMWNLGIPYRLKHYIDVITQPGLTFSWTPEKGYQGLVHERRAVVIYASPFDYAGESPLRPLDQQKRYMETWLRFIGIEDARCIDCGPTHPAAPRMAQAQAEAARRAAALAGWLSEP